MEDMEEYDHKDCRMSGGNYCHLQCLQQAADSERDADCW